MNFKQALQALKAKKNPALESLPRINIGAIRFEEGKILPTDFKSGTEMLERPYFPITEAIYKKILQKMQEKNTDVGQYSGVHFTVGNADSGFAIMPLKKEAIALL